MDLNGASKLVSAVHQNRDRTGVQKVFTQQDMDASSLLELSFTEERDFSFANLRRANLNESVFLTTVVPPSTT